VVLSAPGAEDVQHVAVGIGHVDECHRAAVGVARRIALRGRDFQDAERGPNVEQRELAARAVGQTGVAHQQRIVADGIGGPGVLLRAPLAILGVPQVREHVDIVGVQAEVEAVAVAMPQGVAVVDPDGAALLGSLGVRLQDGLSVAAEVV